MTRKQSKKSRRHDRILGVLETNPTIRVNALAQELDVSTETVRRDLAELDETGRLRRTYGGAVRTTVFEPALAERLKQHIHERERIAQRAVELIADTQNIFIGGGATTLHFARALRAIERRITVITPSIGAAMELSVNPLIEVMLLPGIVEPKEGLVHGAETVRFISRYRAQIAVVGASALDETGISEALLSSAQVYAAIIRNVDEVVVVADSSKFGNRSLQQMVEWGPHIRLVADQMPEPSLAGAITRRGAVIETAQAEPH
ncbi:DeoR/GlpR family DNA-binding transcription regulator [Roseovarius pelagicus]|uniref:DeoR/GlpR family DNA-binding transcription regulator n=1 Tax=Roseovarius pelagicus TaxID=2980108 RepID=A0ABY6D6E9_9RHOB|nr:DeoR/GlpR family DNA-binding transcription regulator [Roseovarius pelagicus]UXX81712.1 DeoR/GlpR family DNA-binding transcription regulator [Roseovarius pelagicus]